MPPDLWFELFKLERTGNEAQDADRLFTVFARIFLGWEAVDDPNNFWPRMSTGSMSIDCLPFFIARVGCELGTVYADAFYRHCGSRLPFYTVGHILAQADYAEREQFPFVVAPERYQGLMASIQSRPLDLWKWAKDLVLEPDVCWGPKFSQFYWSLLWGRFAPEHWDHLTPSAEWLESEWLGDERAGLNIVAWMLDPQVRTEAILQLKDLLSSLLETLDETLLREELRYAAQDGYTQSQYFVHKMNPQQKACICVQPLLGYMEEAERVQHLCAQLREQTRVQGNFSQQ